MTITPGQSSVFDRKVNELQTPGVYYGSLTLSGPVIFRVPLMISTSPLLLQSTFIVLIGVLSSIFFIEYGKLRNKTDNEDFLKHESQSKTDLSKQVEEGIKIQAGYKYTKYLMRYFGIRAKIRTILIDIIPGSFALGLVVAGLVNNEIVGAAIELRYQNVISLFALGFGIESEKEIADRVS